MFDDTLLTRALPPPPPTVARVLVSYAMHVPPPPVARVLVSYAMHVPRHHDSLKRRASYTITCQER